MAGDPTIDIKVVIYPFQEMRKKKLRPMMEKEIGLKKPKNFEFKDKFSVTSVKMTKNRILDDAKTMFRYDLSILAAQMWEQYVPIEKAKNGQDKMKAIKAFIKIVPSLLDRTEKKLQQSFAEFKEDVASGASDDAGVLKSTRKSLTENHPGRMARAILDHNEDFEKDLDALKKLKAAETKASGPEKSKATEELTKACNDIVSERRKKLDGLHGVLKKRCSVLTGIAPAMKKSMGKDISDSAKSEFAASMTALIKGVKPVEAEISKAYKDTISSFDKIKRKDIGSSTLMLGIGKSNRMVPLLGDLSDLMDKIDKKMKKLEQIAKKR